MEGGLINGTLRYFYCIRTVNPRQPPVQLVVGQRGIISCPVFVQATGPSVQGHDITVTEPEVSHHN